MNPHLCTRRWATVWLGIAILALAGCSPKGPRDIVEVPNVHEARPTLPAHVQRVALLPIYYEAFAEESDAYIDDVVAQAVRQEQRFEIVRVPRETLRDWVGHPQLSLQDRLPRSLLQLVSDTYGANAILIVQLHEFRPYPPMQVGMEAQLVDIFSGETLWAVDHSEVAANPALQKAAKSVDSKNTPGGVQAFDARAAYSPRRFLEVVSQSIFYTLPQRTEEP